MEDMPKVALLSTGDEIVHGDILNSNAQDIARQLYDEGIAVGNHMTVPDDIKEITKAINYLLESHQGLIITGGLGPTSDDLTRFALSEATGSPLVFDEASWEKIVLRLNKFGYHTPPESNRQQALFPRSSTIIDNPNGTAAGCMMHHHNHLIFMLPGPPKECLPLLQSTVLPELKKADFIRIRYHKKWLLFGVSEGHIAQTLDALVKPYRCSTGYRLFYPYIEFKLHSEFKEDFDALLPQIEAATAPHLIFGGQKTASKLLREKLETLDKPIIIYDKATGGLLEATLSSPKTIQRIRFSETNPDFFIEGLDAFWQQIETNQTTLRITHHNHINETSIPFRGAHVKEYAVEFCCWKIAELLNN